MASLSNTLGKAALATAAAGALCVGYGIAIERRWFRRRRYELDVLPDGHEPLSILHLSDLHFLPWQGRKEGFIASLRRADVTVVTGDLLGDPAAVERAVSALRPVRGRLASYFVLGSNDYFAPRPLNYFWYFLPNRKPRYGIPGRSDDLVAQLEADGWQHLRNRKATLSRNGTRFEVVGLDDPHIQRHDMRVAPREDSGAFGLAVVHSPDPAPELAALGYQVILAGHTHGGQVRMPFVGALTSNCTIPTSMAMGMTRLGPSFLHVSPGLGSSKYAPFRFLCRPEATLIELRPRRAAAAVP